MDELVLGGDLAEMARLPEWVDALATEHAIADEIKFAINLCLEEAVSNVIRHGHVGVKVRLHAPLEFVVEDDGPRFNPLEAGPLPSISAAAETQLGGQGIRLIQEFADSLDYEEIAGGNRLRIGFRNEAKGLRPR